MGVNSSELQRACGKTAKNLWPGRFLPHPLSSSKGLLEGVGWGGDWDCGEEQWDGKVYLFSLGPGTYMYWAGRQSLSGPWVPSNVASLRRGI